MSLCGSLLYSTVRQHGRVNSDVSRDDRYRDPDYVILISVLPLVGFANTFSEYGQRKAVATHIVHKMLIPSFP